ncbi:MAG: hypothetical protein WD101_02810 [Gemmatimonadota bacterium]
MKSFAYRTLGCKKEARPVPLLSTRDEQVSALQLIGEGPQAIAS